MQRCALTSCGTTVKGRLKMLTWKKEMDVNIESIDVQHRTLIVLINELQHVIDNRMPDVMVGSILSKVIEYARFHFEHEENCLIVGCYAKLHEHRCAHNDLAKKLKSMEQDFNAGIPGIAPKVVELLQQWVISHIMKTDSQYSDQLMKAGLQ
ncbi:MAG: hemerythrin family protein [Bacteroidetes bacterium]|nr:hemerythrin family protein [Bacteroidota bacterium]